MREILEKEEEEEEEEEPVEERMEKGKKKVKKAEGIILLICLDPVKLQIALNQCFMTVLQISFIYTLWQDKKEPPFGLVATTAVQSIIFIVGR